MTRIFDPRTDPLNFTFDYNPLETAALKQMSYADATVSDLRRIALWKLDRVLDVPETLINDLRELAEQYEVRVDSSQSRSLLERLVTCDGVGYPMASAILKFFRPDVFPIIDVRAYRALTGKTISYRQYTTEMYIEYARKVAEIARERSRPLADIDEQLYCFDREYNRSIGRGTAARSHNGSATDQ